MVYFITGYAVFCGQKKILSVFASIDINLTYFKKKKKKEGKEMATFNFIVF